MAKILSCSPFERLEDIMPGLMEKYDENSAILSQTSMNSYTSNINPVDWGGLFTIDFSNIYRHKNLIVICSLFSPAIKKIKT